MKTEYTEKTDMKQFKNISDVSFYNWNYYVGFNKDILFGKSDDDNTTEWWIIAGASSKHLGYSLTSEGDILHLNDEVLS